MSPADDAPQEYFCVSSLLPSFVAASTAASMLFIGRSLIHIRTRSDSMDASLRGSNHLS